MITEVVEANFRVQIYYLKLFLVDECLCFSFLSTLTSICQFALVTRAEHKHDILELIVRIKISLQAQVQI